MRLIKASLIGPKQRKAIEIGLHALKIGYVNIFWYCNEPQLAFDAPDSTIFGMIHEFEGV